MTKKNTNIEVITVEIDSINKINLYVNNSNKVPVKKVVYDLFNSGQLFVNYPLHAGRIVGVRDTMQTIYTSYLLKDTFMKEPDYLGSLPSWVQRYVDDDYNGWAFDVSLIFDTVASSIPVPVCKSFTGQLQDGTWNVSDKYLFANKQDSILSNCSDSRVYVDKLIPHMCVYNGQFSSCPFYQYDYDVVKSFTANQSAHNPQNFELRRIKHQNNFVTYQLFDLTNSQINYVIYEQDTPEFNENALLVMQEVLSAYPEFSENQPKNKEDLLDVSTKKSYILSLI